jgi:hypothetical protein
LVFDGIVTLGGKWFHGICPLRSVLFYNFDPQFLVFDGIVSLGNFQFHGLLALGVMDFMQFVPIVQSFHPILSLRTGILYKSLSGDSYFYHFQLIEWSPAADIHRSFISFPCSLFYHFVPKT